MHFDHHAPHVDACCPTTDGAVSYIWPRNGQAISNTRYECTDVYLHNVYRACKHYTIHREAFMVESREKIIDAGMYGMSPDVPT
jgi:hypothetical protein